MAELTLLGLYSFDNTLFDLMVLPSTIDREILIETILVDLGDRQVIYPNGDWMKIAIKSWSKKYQNTFKKWSDALAIEYEPLENYDRIEESTDISKAIGSSKYNVTTFENDTYHPKDENTSTGTGTQKHSARLHGNIGVTTSQQMLQSELDLHKKFNIYNEITKLFKDAFIVAIF